MFTHVSTVNYLFNAGYFANCYTIVKVFPQITRRSCSCETFPPQTICIIRYVCMCMLCACYVHMYVCMLFSQYIAPLKPESLIHMYVHMYVHMYSPLGAAHPWTSCVYSRQSTLACGITYTYIRMYK